MSSFSLSINKAHQRASTIHFHRIIKRKNDDFSTIVLMLDFLKLVYFDVFVCCQLTVGHCWVGYTNIAALAYLRVEMLPVDWH